MNYSDAPAKLDELQASHGFLASVENSRAELVPSPRADARNGASRRWLGDKYTIQNNMAHWEDRDNWFNKDTPECPRKELWHGQRFLQLSYFFDQNKESPLPVICKHCNSIVSVSDIATRRTELGIDNVYESFEYTCCTCYSVFELWPKFMRGCPLNQAYLFHEDGFNAFTRRSRSIATIQISNACSHKQSWSTQNNFHVYSFIPTVHLSDGIVHKLDAFFQPLIDQITDLYLHGTIINLEGKENIVSERCCYLEQLISKPIKILPYIQEVCVINNQDINSLG